VKTTKLRRVVGRSCLVGAAAALALAFAPWTAFAQTAGGDSGLSSSSGSSSTSSRPRIFTSNASATAVEFFPDRNNGFTIPDAARVRFVSGDSDTSQTGGPDATASIADPGGGVNKGPAQVCGLAGGPVSQNLPQLSFVFDACNNAHWPFTVEADEFQNDVATTGATEVGQPTGMMYGQGGSAHARLNSDDFSSSTDAVLGGIRLNPLPGANSTGLPLPALPLPGAGSGSGATTAAPVDPTVFNIGALAASTSNSFDGPTLVSHSESHIQSIHLLGGLLTIDSLTTVAESRSADQTAPVGTSSVSIEGVTVAGQKAGIGSNGITFGDSGAGDPNTVNDALNQTLANAGVAVKLIGATQSQSASGLMNATAQGVEIDFAHPVDFSRTPLAALGLTDTYTAKLLLGFSSTGDLARNLNVTRPLTGLTPGGSSTGASTSGVSSGSKVGTPQTGAPAAGAAGGAGDNQGSGNSQDASFLGLDPGRIRFLYLSFTLVALGLCLSPRLTVPHRLPGAAR
jgi:hypothetical protein